MRALLDSGSSVSLLDYDWYLEYRGICRFPTLEAVSASCRSVSGEKLRVVGSFRPVVGVGDFTWPIKLWVVKGLCTDLLLGCDFSRKTGMVLDYSKGQVYFRFRPSVRMRLCQAPTLGEKCAGVLGEDKFDVKHLGEKEARDLLELLHEFPAVLTDKLGVTNKIEYRIRLTDEVPVRQSPYRLSPPKMKALRGLVEGMLKEGVIRPSTSPYASPMFLVPKPNGGGFRPVVDYRELNRKVVLESVPIPDLHNCFTWFSGAQYFTVLDLNQAYYQIPLAEESKAATAFVTDWNLYEFNRVPFGLSTGAAVLSRLLDSVLGDLKFKCVYNYLDDVVVYSSSFADHLVHLRQVLVRLGDAGLTVKPSKVNLARRQISFLGHCVSARGVSVDHSRTHAIHSFRPPRTKKAIARFIGMVNFFRKFIPKFAELAAPLNFLRRKGVPFQWGESQQASFESLKEALSNAPVLGIPDFGCPFILQTDASSSGLAAVLLQEQDGERRPIGYASRSLTAPEAKYSTYELEALAVLFGTERFKFYLEHREFQLETDNQALSWVLARPRKTGRIARWAVRLSAFKFSVKHVKGSDNVVADTLSRMFEDEQDSAVGAEPEEVELVGVVLNEIPELFKDLRERQGEDPVLSSLRRRLEGGEILAGYELRRGILCKRTSYDGRFKICLPGVLIPAVFQYYHHSLSGAHLGVFKTLQRIRESLTWPTLYKDVRKLVGQCRECKIAKPNSEGKRGLLQSTRVETPLERLFIDYVGPLPRTRGGYRYILVAVDAFSRFVWLIPTCGVTAGGTINQLARIFSWFGPPREIVSDNAPAFVSREFRQFCFKQGIIHITTTPYYPQPSFAERFNRNLKAALIAYHSEAQGTWDRSLPWLNLAFNTATHESHQSTPASLIFSYATNSPLSNLWSIRDLLPEHVSADRLRDNWTRARANIRKAHLREAARYNRGRRPANFKVGEWVYVRNFGGPEGRKGGSGKLAPRFSGPWEIKAVPTPVTLRVYNQEADRLQRVHLSQVKPAGPRQA